jgi:hypothetical protein
MNKNNTLKFIKKHFWMIQVPALLFICYWAFTYVVYCLYKLFDQKIEKITLVFGTYFAWWVCQYVFGKANRILDCSVSRMLANKKRKPQPHVFDEGCEFPDSY